MVVNGEELIEITSHVLGRHHAGIDVHQIGVFHLELERAGQDGVLDFTGHGEVSLDIHQLGMFLLGALDIFNLLHRLVNGYLEVVQVYRLGGKIESAVVHGMANILHVSVGAYHDALEGGIAHLVHLGQKRETVHFGHVDVRKDDGDVRMLQQDLKGFQSVVGKEELVLALSYLSAKELRQQQFEIGFIINAENFYCHGIL